MKRDPTAIEATLNRLTDAYELECRNTMAPGNPFLNAISGRIGGIKETLSDPYIAKCMSSYPSLVYALTAMVETAECRGDEDCDHCVAVRVLAEAK